MTGSALRAASLALSSIGVLVIGAQPALASSATSQHNVVCRYHPDVPYQFGPGGQVTGEAEISCSPTPPDVSSTTVRVWRYDSARGKYYLVAERTSNRLSTGWTLGATGKCTARVAYRMHTEVINDSFHGTWGHTVANSPEVTLYC
jgi:hypothetical protein